VAANQSEVRVDVPGDQGSGSASSAEQLRAPGWASTPGREGSTLAEVSIPWGAALEETSQEENRPGQGTIQEEESLPEAGEVAIMPGIPISTEDDPEPLSFVFDEGIALIEVEESQPKEDLSEYRKRWAEIRKEQDSSSQEKRRVESERLSLRRSELG
jgi:hypothetical protein